MVSNINNTQLIRYSQIPRNWNGIFNYHKAIDQHYGDGWRDIIFPSYNPNTQKLGDLIQDGDTVTYQVIDLPPQEITQRIKSELQSNRQQTIQTKLEKSLVDEAQTLTDDAEILENKSLYDVWDDLPDQFPFPSGFKVNQVDGTDIRTFRIIQPHNKQSDRVPSQTPALWTEIVMSGDIEVWSQPTGGDGKYPYINPETNNPYQVLHNGQTWVNDFQEGLNVWVPGEYGWMQI